MSARQIPLPEPAEIGDTGFAFRYTDDQMRAHAAAARRQALEDAQSDLAQALCDDCENGVKWLNEKAAKDFAEKYPHLSAAIRSLIDKDTA